MKINKKTIIIAIIVAVVAFLIWKRMKAKSVNAEAEINEPENGGTNTSSIDSILAAIGATSSEISYVRRTASAIDASPSWSESVKRKAKSNGVTYQQQVVCEALWMLYHPADHWTNDRGWKLTNKVLALY